MLFAAFCALPLSAQDAENDAPDEDSEEEVVELDPFQVTTTDDRGYLTTNSTSLTSINDLIRDLPVGVDVVNTEFIEDIQATDMKEALAYSAGVYFSTQQNTSSANTAVSRDYSPSSGAKASEFNDVVIIRGYSVPNQQRMGFRVGTIVPGYGVTLGGITDSANIERQEVVRGPQSLLYGINVLSGIVNFLPKEPLPEVRTNVGLSVGSRGFMRALFDHTGPVLKDTLNYRFIASYLEQDYETDFKNQQRDYVGLQFKWTPNDKLSLFLEAQYASNRVEGIGQQFYYGTVTGLNNFDFGNRYDERYAFGYDYDNSAVFDQAYLVKDPNLGALVEGLGVVQEGSSYYTEEGATLLIPNPLNDYSQSFDLKSRHHNVSGPDTFREREEWDLLSVLRYRPTDDLNIELGVFYTTVEDEEFNVRLQTINNSYNTIIPGNVEQQALNPELVSMAVDPLGFGVGELFLSPSPLQNETGVAIADRKYATYFWYRKPTSSESLQMRLRLAYTFDTLWFDRIDATHTITGGLQFIQDDVSFVNDQWNTRTYYSSGPEGDNRLAEDPLIFRNSIFDTEPIRYDPSLGDLAIPGNLRIVDTFSEDAPDYIKRSGWYDVTLWYRGQYLVYHGKYLNDRLTAIAGVRRDSYQAREKERLRILDPDHDTSFWQGNREGGGYAQVPYFAGYGDGEFAGIDALPDTLNAKVAAEVSAYHAENPRGTTAHLFDDFQNYVTKTLGLSFRVSDSISAYYLFSEGIFPNTGQRDGAYQPMEAESTVNNEVGIKFELFHRKISGRIAFWQINRENAVWNWEYAPAPAKWWGGPANVAGTEDSSSFSPDRVDLWTSESGSNEARDIRYGVAQDYVVLAYEQLGMEVPMRRGLVLWQEMTDLGAVGAATTTARNPRDPTDNFPSIFVSYHDVVAADSESGQRNPLALALDLAVRNSENLKMEGFPIYYFGSALPTHQWSHSASDNGVNGANVAFEEEGRGIDGQIIVSPFDDNRYQLIFGYSYQKREVTSFNLVSGYAVDGNGDILDERGLYTTPYDIWVMLLGPENFENPADPSTLRSGAINGIDLSFVPRTNFNLWNKYSFKNGFLKGLELGGGVNFYGKTPTSVEVGGSNMNLNPYPTPDIPSHFTGDLYVGYRTRLWDVDWRLSLNVYNVANTIKEEAVAFYDESASDLRSRYRRTLQYYDARSVRVSLSATF